MAVVSDWYLYASSLRDEMLSSYIHLMGISGDLETNARSSIRVFRPFCEGRILMPNVPQVSSNISVSSLRSFNVSMSLENDLLEYIDNEFQSELNVYGRFVVFPTFVSDIVTVRSSDVLPHDAMLVDEFGRILHTVSFNGSVQISMNDYISGSYFIVVDNQERIKIMKK